MTCTPGDSRWNLRERRRALRVEIGLVRARRVVASPTILRAIELVAREHHLTSKQVELVAYATTDVNRTVLIATLGVSRNTLATRVRKLIREFDEKSLDSIGKMVLRRAIDTVSPS